MEVGGKLTRRDFLVLGAFSLLLYCYACYGGRVLTQHEARLPQASIEMANAGEWLIPTCGGRPWLERPPLPHWLTIGIASVCGVWDQVWVFRIPNALAGVLSVLLTGWLGARFFGREIGLLSGLMLATSYEFVHYAWLAEEDIYLAAAVLVGMVLFVKLEFDAPVAHGQPSVDQLSIDQQRLSLFGNRSRAVWIFFLVMGLSNLVKGLCFAAVMVGLSGGGVDVVFRKSSASVSLRVVLGGVSVCGDGFVVDRGGFDSVSRDAADLVRRSQEPDGRDVQPCSVLVVRSDSAVGLAAVDVAGGDGDV